MYYELYIDVFFLENFMLDSLLLMAVNRVMQYRNSYARMLAGGAAGSFLTCVVIALPLMPAIKTLLFGVGINSVMIFAGLGGDVLKKGRKQSKKELAAWFLRDADRSVCSGSCLRRGCESVSSVYEICRSVLRSICSRILCIYGNVEVYIAHKTEYEKSSGSNIVYKSWGKESDRSYRYGK